MPQFPLVPQEADARAVDGFDEQFVQCLAGELVYGRRVTESLEKRLSQGCPDLEQVRVPFAVGVDVGESR
ncbi:hypothetical protein [Streptomyces mirabilis]|uniref:hypothetical protein n=1 Tax=Streptomyces mirabilis TaxID=68239 RepID=UPI0036DF2C14